ncbi:MAG: nucleoside-diphosphate sugar epimerase/dehydratase [Deltaproteobacteria bacterium]|nr:nucleoside-diphosphate sugar epimerase/dehydratase [Deltaproteobacteria bacterium]
MLRKDQIRLYVILANDIVLSVLSYFLAYLLRFSFSIPDLYMQTFLVSLPMLLVFRVVTFYYFGLYRGLWRYASVNDLIRIIKAITSGSVLFSAYVAFYFRAASFPRSVIIIDWFILLAFIGGTRLLYRLSKEMAGAIDKRKKTLIIGASDEGEMLIREMKKNPKMGYEPVAILDQAGEKKGKLIHDVPVLGDLTLLEHFIREKKIEEVVVADPSITGKQLRYINETLSQLGIKVKIAPYIGDILNGKISVTNIREINVEDLLGRENIRLNREKIQSYLSRKRVLVTGAGGSIGSELSRQIMKIEPERLVMLERSENELFSLSMEFSERYKNGPYVPVLGDILDREYIRNLMLKYKPQVVFHAAAYKHVPITELHPYETVKNNILGTFILAEASYEYGVEKFVLISTDKAVDPINIMGATKRIAELICQSFNQRGKTKYICVRFGNVLGSSGSVVPIFREQISKGGPVTITHPDMTRFFMSVSEAVQLVMQAGAMGNGGEIYVLDMGEPVKIVDLAKDMIRLMGLKEEDVEIVYTGIRPGERIKELLVGSKERIERTEHEKIMKVVNNDIDWSALDLAIRSLIENLPSMSEKKIREALFRIINHDPLILSPSTKSEGEP